MSLIADADTLLDAIQAVLVAAIDELTDKNTIVWHHGQGDPSEDIAAASARTRGVCLLIIDAGGDETAGDGDSPILEHDIHLELYIDSAKRGKIAPGKRYGGQIRDAIMRAVHNNSDLREFQHCMFDTRVRGFQRISDPDYAVWRIRLARTFALEISPS